MFQVLLDLFATKIIIKLHWSVFLFASFQMHKLDLLSKLNWLIIYKFFNLAGSKARDGLGLQLVHYLQNKCQSKSVLKQWVSEICTHKKNHLFIILPAQSIWILEQDQLHNVHRSEGIEKPLKNKNLKGLWLLINDVTQPRGRKVWLFSAPMFEGTSKTDNLLDQKGKGGQIFFILCDIINGWPLRVLQGCAVILLRQKDTQL